MSTLKRQRADGTWEYVQLTGEDVTEMKERLDETTSQLAETAKEASRVRVNSKLNRGIVTFFTDDGNIRDYTTIRSIFANEGVPCNTGIVPSRILDPVTHPETATLEQLKELRDVHGWGIEPHTYYHDDLTTMTAQEIDDDFGKCKEFMIENNFNYNTLAIPFGRYNSTVKEVARKHYRSVRVSSLSKDGYNDTPLDTYELSTIWMDEAVVALPDVNGFKVNTFEYYKHFIDKARDENKWLIISFHSWDTGKTIPMRQLLTDVLAYANANTDVITMGEALDRTENIVDSGAGGRINPSEDYFRIGSTLR